MGAGELAREEDTPDLRGGGDADTGRVVVMPEPRFLRPRAPVKRSTASTRCRRMSGQGHYRRKGRGFWPRPFRLVERYVGGARYWFLMASPTLAAPAPVKVAVAESSSTSVTVAEPILSVMDLMTLPVAGIFDDADGAADVEDVADL